MKITRLYHRVAASLIFSPIQIEHRAAAYVAKLHQQAQTYQAWHQALADDADVKVCERLFAVYDAADQEAAQANDKLQAALGAVCSPSQFSLRSLMALQQQAKLLIAMHLVRLRYDMVAAGAETRAAAAFKNRVCGTTAEAHAKRDHEICMRTRKRFEIALHRTSDAAADHHCSVYERSCCLAAPKPKNSILKRPAAHTAVGKKISWAAVVPCPAEPTEAATPAIGAADA